MMLKMIDPDIDLSEMIERTMGINVPKDRNCTEPNQQNQVQNERNHPVHNHHSFNNADREGMDE